MRSTPHCRKNSIISYLKTDKVNDFWKFSEGKTDRVLQEDDPITLKEKDSAITSG